MMNNTSAIAIKNLSLTFGEKKIFDSFSLIVNSGEKVTLTGNSATGKTSLMRCILGFIVPNQGVIQVCGCPVNAHSVWEVRATIAYVAQEPEMGTGRVKEVLHRPFTYHVNRHLRNDVEQLKVLFEEFQLSLSLLDKEIGTVSGGEKQRIAIVSALLLERPVLLLDEATSALDNSLKCAVVDYIRSREDLTVLSAAHDPRDYCFGDRIETLSREGERRDT